MDHPPAGWWDHVFVVRAGDEWCSSCDDWVVNGCGSLTDCEQRERDDELERETERDWDRTTGPDDDP